MPSSGYVLWSVTAGEQPTTAKWNLLGSNDASFNAGNGLNDSVIVARHLANGSVTPPAANDLTKAVNRQNITTNSVVTNQLIQYGWGYFTGSGARSQSQTVTFPVAYDNVPMVVLSYNGARNTSRGVPASPSDAIDGYYDVIHGTAAVATTTNVIAAISFLDAASIPTAMYHLYSWIAIGTKAR
jgi:hypothetical protein